VAEIDEVLKIALVKEPQPLPDSGKAKIPLTEDAEKETRPH